MSFIVASTGENKVIITAPRAQALVDCLRQWRTAAWAGDAYKYCEASNERDRILDDLLGEGTSPSNSDNNQNNKGDI